MPGHGERAKGQEPLLSHKRSWAGAHRAKYWGRPVHGNHEDLAASQDGQGAVEAAGCVIRGEEHGDSTGGSRLGWDATPRGVCDQTGEVRVRRVPHLNKLHLNGKERGAEKRCVGKGLEEGARYKGAKPNEGVHGRPGMAEIVPDGGHSRERRFAAPFFRFVKQTHKRT